MTIAQGQKIALARATLADRAKVHAWLSASDLTSQVMGPPLFPERRVPNFEEFCDLYPPFHFDGTRAFDGRGFMIRVDGDDVGFLNHGPINLFKDVVELDLWLASGKVARRGYGSDAVQTACNWLQQQYGVNRFLMRPSRRNVHALRALRRAGFRETDLDAAEVISKLGLPRGHYADEVLLFRILDLPPATLDVQPGRTYVFIDSEFTSLTEPRLISFGAVATDATAFYCELSGFPQEHCSEFVRDTVLPLLDGDAVPHPVASQSFAQWLAARCATAPAVVVSDSGFDRWAMADLFGREDLPAGVRWVRVPVAYEQLDEVARGLGLRRHHALDDARALRHAVINGGR